jgi:urease accessory protein
MTTAATPGTIEGYIEKVAASCVRASLRLDFSRDAGTGQTFLAGSLQEPPLKVVRAFPLEDGTALAHLHNVSGGLVGGDQLGLQVHVGDGAKVQLTTTSATRIYRHRQEMCATTQQNEIAVGANALLEYVPDAMIPFAGSRFKQKTTIRLAAGAGLYWWEIIAPGREASGELFAYEQFEMRTKVITGKRTIAAENILLSPRGESVASPARLGSFRYFATFYICAVDREASAWRATEEHIRELTAEFTKPGESLWGVSTVLAHGLVVRCLARHGRDVVSGLHAVWNRAKVRLHGCEAIPPRKVN